MRQSKAQREAGSPHAATREELRRQAKALAREQRAKEQRRDGGKLEHVRRRREKGLKAREAAFAEARAKSKERAAQEMQRRRRQDSEAKAKALARARRPRDSSAEEEKRAVQALLSVQNTPRQSSDDELSRGGRLPPGSGAMLGGPPYTDSAESDGGAPAGPTREQLLAKAMLEESGKKVRVGEGVCWVCGSVVARSLR